ncbi:hypothetical protein CEXT_538641 [Caerostris extrusa]|uniref:Uncharacterized protein n=1 Tax=Caerostris extrusa TaxID=172846 RepID=A0AAV4Y7D8_CAEEX|nr:hypothetical protein CEXT_538641 [Caerostris extrusa]
MYEILILVIQPFLSLHLNHIFPLPNNQQFCMFPDHRKGYAPADKVSSGPFRIVLSSPSSAWPMMKSFTCRNARFAASLIGCLKLPAQI